ncbi:conserved hypothetical protein [Hymenobacter roseosalivarius DSM 11622]|jgi:hypothetical protein|uniref:SiaC family regulatory phosphoprotein domain-containing protein n=1 Tax=Hymenobacter roseosalivarius DSM 11622 TaxID=645990 RepID=A0A1W1UG95_9BACT|nr:DUF6572 domain-containing protein [Hymenobacter roseosalivarius]SMB79804.1 conserved hypothetical protein [Hymenobacter roseosalivarius DSM 11622]
MSIEQTDTIDIITISPEGELVLTISDHLSWEEDEHLSLLEDKINTYLEFLEGEQLLEEYPAAKEHPLVINVALQFEPPEQAIHFLTQAMKVITDAGIGFHWRVVSDQ